MGLNFCVATTSRTLRKKSEVMRRIRMKNPTKITLLSAALAILALPVVAQNQTTDASGNVTGQSIQDRKANQQDRIGSGVKNGELTAGEATNLEKKEAGLNQEERDMRQEDNGRLTGADKTALT